MGKVRLRAEGKSREEAFGKLVKLAKFYPKHVFKNGNSIKEFNLLLRSGGRIR